MSEPGDGDAEGVESAEEQDAISTKPDPEARARTLRRVASTVIWIALVVLFVIAARRVGAIEDGEVRERSAVLALEADHGRFTLVEADLARDHEVLFELCSGSNLDPATYDRRIEVAIVQRGAPDSDVIRTLLDHDALEAARRSPAQGTCIDVGRGVIETAGRYAIEIAHPERLPEARVEVQASIRATRPLTASDRNLVLALLAATLFATLLLYGAVLPPLGRGMALPAALSISGLAGLALYVFMRWGTPLLPGGTLGGLWAGTALALLEVALAIGLTLRSADRIALLGVGRAPSTGTGWARAQPYVLLVTAPLAGFALFRIAGLALRLVPSTGEAPIEAFVASPSGMLSFAALAVVAPVAEELFFRGLIYGALLGDGTAARKVLAFVGAWIVFAAIHLPQTWGSWGGALSIAIAALAFTALRAASGSIVVPAIAHLVYNGLLSAQALLSAS